MSFSRSARTSARISVHAITPTASVWLDVIRATAAAAVMIGHARGLLFVPYADAVHHGPMISALYLFTSLGHQAVMVFFVLSGLLVGRSVLSSMLQGKWTWNQYLVRRLSRLYIVLIPALCLTALWDLGGVHFWGESGVYAGLLSDRAILPTSVLSRDTFGTFVGNSAFLMTVVVPVFGSNGPLWSLANEFWYYLLFPVALILGGDGRWGNRLLAGCGVLVLLWLLPTSLLLLFPTWLLGVLISVLPSIELSPGRHKLLALAALGLVLIAAAAGPRLTSSTLVSDYAVAVSFALFLYLLLTRARNSNGRSDEPPAARPTGFWSACAGFSYTLYLVHLPPLVFLHAWLYARSAARWQPDATHLALSLGVCTAALAYAYLISRFTEARTDRCRRWLERHLGRIGSARGAMLTRDSITTLAPEPAPASPSVDDR